MRHIRPVLLVAAVGIVVTSLSGCIALCAAGAAGAGVAYTKGDTETTIGAEPPQVAMAAEQAFLQLGMVVTSSSAGATDAEVIARTARDVKVDVTVKAQSAGTSHVAVRAGTWGDDELQARVLAKIHENLAAPAPPETAGN